MLFVACPKIASMYLKQNKVNLRMLLRSSIKRDVFASTYLSFPSLPDFARLKTRRRTAENLESARRVPPCNLQPLSALERAPGPFCNTLQRAGFAPWVSSCRQIPKAKRRLLCIFVLPTPRFPARGKGRKKVTFTHGYTRHIFMVVQLH